MKITVRLIALLLLLACLPAAAQYRVDDTGSRVLNSNIRMKWDTVIPRRGEVPTVSGTSQVYIRLNVAQWKGKSGRIFMTLPPQSFGELEATWTARQRLLPGRLVSGDRGGLVYSGLIDTATIEDTILLTLRTDGQRLEHVEQLEFGFRIELTP